MQNKNHKLAAIIFTDIVGYTRQMEENEHKTMQLLQRQREIVFPLVKEHGGEVIKEIGDGLLMMFTSAIEAVQFSIKLQQLLKDEELTIRAGIHIGDVIFEDGDVFGSAVNTAARIEPLAEPNGICISENVKQQLGNKNIRMISCGKKELKGVNRPIEIFEVFVEGVSQEKKVTAKGFIKDLWNRYVIQITAIYLIAAWVIKLAVSTIVTKNLLSPHITELTWVILLSLIPTVILISFFHGKRRQNKWHKAELIGLPANLLFTAILLFSMFQGKDLGAATKTVMIEDIDGKKVEHYVVKSEFRKKICLYNFKNLSSDTSLNWLQYMTPTCIEYDLMQDQFITPLASVKFYEKLARAGYEDGTEMPVAIMKKFALYQHLNYFMVGNFDVVDGEYFFNTKLYETANAKMIQERSYSGSDIFKIFDQITVQIKEDVGIPLARIEEADDLPIGEIFTKSVQSLKQFGIANKSQALGDWKNAVKNFELAVETDPGFAIAYISLVGAYFNTNQMVKATAASQLAMDNIDKVPERLQYQIKFVSYLLKQEPDKAFAIIKMWVDLYPEDVHAHTTLAQRYILADNTEGAIKEYKIVLQLDPEQYDFLPALGKLYQKIGKPDSALYYFHQYAEIFPKDYQSYYNIGQHYDNNADFINAKEYFEKALLLEPDNITVSIQIANIEYNNGNYDKALEGYQQALSISKNAQDSSKAYSALSIHYRRRGKLNLSLEYFEKSLGVTEKFRAPLQIIVQKTFSVSNYVDAGRKNEIFEYLDKVKSALDPPLDKLAAFGYMLAYIELNDAENAAMQIPDVEELAKAFGEEMLLANVYYAWGRIYEMQGEYEKAIESYNDFFESQPSGFHIKRFSGRVYRKMGDYKKAEENILLALKHSPYSAKSNYEAALLYKDMGEEAKALQHLKLANEIWKEADPNYKIANEAKDLQKRIETKQQ